MHKFLIKLRNPIKKFEGIFSYQRCIKTNLAMADPQIQASMDEDIEPKESWFRSWFPYFKWVPTSPEQLKQAEEKIFQFVNVSSRGLYVDSSVSKEDGLEWCPELKNCRIWTREFTSAGQEQETPLVMIHGMGAGLGFFCLNFEELSKNRPIYAIDLPGFGRSSRCSFKTDNILAENQYIGAIEKWRQSMGLNKVVLLGHSFGGYLSSAYAMKFPEHVEHLILADPWGFPERPEDLNQRYNIPIWAKAVFQIYRHFNPLSILRLAGPWGPSLISRMRPDLLMKFGDLFPEDLSEEDRLQKCTEVVPDYIYHTNAQTPSGESAFHAMMSGFAWAKRPMLTRLGEMSPGVPLSVIYGGQSWITSMTKEELQTARGNQGYTNVYIIPEAGHHVYAVPKEFNKNVLKACQYKEKKSTIPS